MIRFDADAFYDEDALRLLGLDSQALAKARREEDLPCRQIGRVRLYKGAWLQAWLSRGKSESTADEGEPRR
jgi:hypothetical protein